MTKTFIYKKHKNVIDIAEIPKSYKPTTIEKSQFFHGYMKIKGTNIDDAINRLTKGRPVKTLTSGKVVKIQDMFKM